MLALARVQLQETHNVGSVREAGYVRVLLRQGEDIAKAKAESQCHDRSCAMTEDAYHIAGL
jgi:hypothetical protein